MAAEGDIFTNGSVEGVKDDILDKEVAESDTGGKVEVCVPVALLSSDMEGPEEGNEHCDTLPWPTTNESDFVADESSEGIDGSGNDGNLVNNHPCNSSSQFVRMYCIN